jgi:hypothetical protein
VRLQLRVNVCVAVILVVGVEAVEVCVWSTLVGGVRVDTVAGGAVGDRATQWEINVAVATPQRSCAGIMSNMKISSRTCRY